MNGGTGGTGVEGPVIVEDQESDKKISKVTIEDKLPEIKDTTS